MPLPTLLIVDDDPDVCEMLRLALGDQYSVVVETDGRRALDALAGIHPDIVVVDLVMPGADGLTVCERIKSERPETIVVIVTATTKGSDLPDSFWRLGTPADGFLSKPFDPQRLVALLHELRVKRVESGPNGPGGQRIDRMDKEQ
ncbi:MAG: response regulator [Candidatus Sumerlaeia bacterium]|nr:response regulator [Candidatus Sumerlaeia bacterium]